MNDMNMTPAPKSRVNALTDAQGRVTRIEGGYTMSNISDLSEWVYLDEGYGDRYNLCQSHFAEGGLYTTDGFPRYKLVSGALVLRSEDELAADRAARPEPAPSQLDRLEAQTTYTALMTDTLLEEG